MAAIAEGQVFPSLLAFKKALHEWAIDRNFTPHILDSDCHRVRAGCRSSPDCPFRVRCNFSEKRGNARVTTCEDIHNCVSTSEQKISQTIKRPEAGKLKFLIEAVPKLLKVPEELTVELITQAVERRYGQKLPLRQAQRVKRALGAKPKGPCRQCRQMGHSRKGCPQACPPGTSDPSGLSFNDLDEDDSGMHVDFDDDGQGEANHQCAHCLQPSQNCTCDPHTATATATTNGVRTTHDPVAQYPNMRGDISSVGSGGMNGGHQHNGLGPASLQRSESSTRVMNSHQTANGLGLAPSQLSDRPPNNKTMNAHQPNGLGGSAPSSSSSRPISERQSHTMNVQQQQHHHHQTNGLSSAPPSQVSERPPPPPHIGQADPSIQDQPAPAPAHQTPQPPQSGRSAQDSRNEAARLMQQAARLMQEAAKLNFEAARLTASWTSQ